MSVNLIRTKNVISYNSVDLKRISFVSETAYTDSFTYIIMLVNLFSKDNIRCTSCFTFRFSRNSVLLN